MLRLVVFSPVLSCWFCRWVYRMSSIYDGLFGETPMAVAIKYVSPIMRGIDA